MKKESSQKTKKSLLEKILVSEDLDKEQADLFTRYKNNSDFIKILQSRTYDEIPHTLDYFRLVEEELTKKNCKKEPDKWKTHFLPSEMAKVFEKTVFNREKALKEAVEIKTCYESKNEWTEKLFPQGKKPLTTPTDIKNVESLCKTLSRTDFDAAEIFVSFYKNLVAAKEHLSQNIIENGRSVEDYLENLPDNWYAEPWYYTYVQYFYTKDDGIGDFGTFKKALDYLEKLGIKNIYILPHYQSPNGDAGYDISDYKPSKDFGGEKKFREFIFEATRRGFRVATDLVFNHTSTGHKWFLKALEGESRYFNYYLKCPPKWGDLNIKDIIRDEDGDLFLYLKESDENGEIVTSKRILIFPDVDKTLWLRKTVKKLDKDVLFYREFYPFQVDLDLQNPEVVNELFEFLGEEVSLGILGKRTDAIAHWIKKPGTDAKDLPETYALQQLIKQFVKHISSKTIILPEVVTNSKKLKEYAGDKTVINGKETTTGGDALFDFQLQAMLREMMYFEKTSPFWTQVHDRGEEGVNTSAPLLPIEHHDETYMGFIQEIEKMRKYITGTYLKVSPSGDKTSIKRGIIYKNGMSGGARYANCLNEDARRIAAAFFCQYMMPAAPVIYYGTEIGATNRPEQMRKRQKEQFNTLKNLLGDDVVGEGKSITFEKCEDPRELQRGSIPAKVYQEALKKKYPAIEVIKILNNLRQEKPALRSYELTNVDTWSESVLGMLKFPKNEAGNALLVVANLSSSVQTAQIPVKQLNKHINIADGSLVRILEIKGNSVSDVVVNSETQRISTNPSNDFLFVDLAAYQCLLFEFVYAYTGMSL